MKVAKPDYKYMHVMFNQCIRENLGKIVGTAFLNTLVIFACMSVLSFIMLALSGAGFGPAGSEIGKVNSFTYCVLSLCIMFASSVFSEILSYGMYDVTARFVLKKNAKIGNLFNGFSSPGYKVPKIALLYKSVQFVIGLPVFLPMLFGDGKAAESSESVNSSFVLFSSLGEIAISVLILAVSVYCIFIWLVYFSKKDIGVRQTFAVSFKLMKGKVLHFIGFMLYCCGIDFAFAVVLILVSFVLPQQSVASGSSVTGGGLATMLMSLAGVIFGYRAFAKFYVSVSVYFYSLIGVLHKHIDVNVGAEEFVTDKVSAVELKKDVNDDKSSAGDDDSDAVSVSGKEGGVNEDAAKTVESAASDVIGIVNADDKIDVKSVGSAAESASSGSTKTNNAESPAGTEQ